MAKDFITKKSNKNVLIVDALNLAFRWKHKKATQFIDEYIRTVKSFATSYGCGKIIIAADWGSSSYRKDLFPDYKGNREALREKQTPEEAEYFLEFIEEYNNVLMCIEDHDMLVLKYKKVEADDIAAFIIKNKDAFGIEEIWNISTDRDWDLMLKENVNRFSYINRKEFTIDNWYDHYEVPPEKYIDYKCLTGDPGDNIPGIPGIGPKRAASMLEEYDSAFDIYEACPIPSKYKYIQNLNDNCEQLLTNLALMDLHTYCEEAIGNDNLIDLELKVNEYLRC